jgi:hypothetical protein
MRLGLFWLSACSPAWRLNLRDGNVRYDKRYTQCIKADKQWIDGNCIDK